jgi:LmbE family N-acetylglucosaminyl deacetylase
MQKLTLDRVDGRPFRVLCLGAHSDDLEIGCYAAVDHLMSTIAEIEILWMVFCGKGVRGEEAVKSAERLLHGVPKRRILLKEFRDGFLPYTGGEVKDCFEELKGLVDPDLILTHYRDDRHQDHRLVSELTWNTWRDHFILEYEIPKYDGDMGSPNLFIPFGEEVLNRKIDHLLKSFASQQGKQWYDPETFRGMARVRGMECASPGNFAEAFYCRKLVLSNSEV